MLATRLATAAVAIPALWLLVWGLSDVLFAGFVLIIIALGLSEFVAMALPAHPRVRVFGVAAGLAVSVAVVVGGSWPGMAVCGAVAVSLLPTLRPGVDLSRAVRRSALWLFGVLYVGYLTPHVVLLRGLPEDGWRWVLMVLFTAMGSDTGGYFGGRGFGRTLLAPGVSPKKTVEGSVGSLVGGAALGVICSLVFFDGEALGRFAIYGIVISILGQVGDLYESALKRACDVKDSGWIVPGHGGILDRLDSLVLPFAAAYYFLAITN